jgi:hypothetical protein
MTDPLLSNRLVPPTTTDEADVFLRSAVALVLGSPELQRH